VSEDPFHVQQLDHVECFVPDRYAAAEWYERVLGLTIVPEYEYWANDSEGPLMISSDGGNTKLALFEGRNAGAGGGGFHQIAFRVNGPGFMAFVERLGELALHGRTGEPLTADSVRDHQGAYSLYFVDPWGHRLEITTYDCEYVSAHL
jgi:catechol 2,3-dioxygenase-like lactoylglutathione lyase family enzyme